MNLGISKSVFWTFVVFVIAGALTVFVVEASSTRPLTALEASMFQILILAISLGASYVFAQKSASVAAQDLIRPHARSAFRRVVRVYVSLDQLARMIDSLRQRTSGAERQDLDLIQAVIEQQIPTIGDALEDWRDIVPKEVEEIERESEQRQRGLEDLRR